MSSPHRIVFCQRGQTLLKSIADNGSELRIAICVNIITDVLMELSRNYCSSLGNVFRLLITTCCVIMVFHSYLPSRALITGSYVHFPDNRESNDATTVQERSSCSSEGRSRNHPGQFKRVYVVIYQPTKYGLFRIHVAPYSSKYTINARISTPWFSVRSVNLMSSHRYHQDQSMISEKGKEKEPVVAAWPKLPDSLNVPRAKPKRRPSLSQSIFAQSQPSNHPPPTEGDPTNTKQSSKTWTSSSEHSDLPVEEDGNDDRRHFVEEYNRLAQRHGLRPLVPGDFLSTNDSENVTISSRRDSWFSKMLRQAAEQSAETDSKPDRSSLRHQRNVSDVASGLVQGHRRDKLSDRDLATLVRLCGKSRLFLPTDYAPFSLTLPTCFRAFAQALVQHADTKGIFRVPGSARVVNELYEYYCTNEDIDAISSTTRCPTLPTHIRCNTHDIASTFKRLLAGLPGGILGSLSLFDALVSIYSRLQGDAEVHRTKESKLRARLIALAIGTVRSRYQRELICAVFGLLCLIGRIAENAPREDDNGRPLPTTDLMGYNALGIVFGPLLIGDLIDDYSMKVADPSAGLILLPISSPRSRKEKHKHRHRHRHRSRHRHKHAPTTVSSSSVDKIRIANSITEMLIVHWREVVRQIRNTGSVKNRRGATNLLQHQGSVRDSLSSSASENLSLSNWPPLDESSSRSASPATVNLATPGMKYSNISSSEVIQKHPTTAIPPVLSPMIEENLSVSFDNHKPTLEEETAKNGEGGYTQNNHSIPSHSHPSPVHGNDLADITSDSERIDKDTVGNIANTATSAVRSTHTQRSEMTPYPRKNMHSTPPLESPIAETTTQYEHDPVTPRAKPPRQSSLYDNIEEIDQSSLNDGLTNRDSQQSQSTTKAAFTGKESSAEPRYDKSGDDSFKNGDILLETPESGYAHSGSLSKHNPIDEVLGSPAGQWKNLLASSGESAESLARSAKARRLKRSSIPILRRPKDGSVLTGSPSTLPKRKQQVLQTGHAPRDNLTSSKPNTGRDSTWKDATGPTRPILGSNAKHYSPGRHSSNIPQFWGSQRSTSKPMPGAVKAMAALFDSAAKESPDGSVVILNGRTRQSPNESTSFPGGGPLDGSPTKSKIPRGPPMPTASSRPNHASSPEKRSSVARSGVSTIRAAPTQPTAEHTPANTTRRTLKPVKIFSSARNEPQMSRNTTTTTIPNQPPRLGTMVPHEEEPPVGHFVRPSSATSAQSQIWNPEGTGLLAAPPRRDSRISSSGSGTGISSLLHAQIRNLQRQLAARNEEIAQLRRRLETQEHMDIGTLCEQLRVARREGMTWRKRAEAAERRVAVFQRFGAKVLLQGPDGVVEEEEDDHNDYEAGEGEAEGVIDGDDNGHEGEVGGYDQGESSTTREKGVGADYSYGYGYGSNDLGDVDGSSSSYSIRTENRRAFNDRIRRSFAQNLRAVGGGDGAVFEDRGQGACDACAVHEYQRSPRTARLWRSEHEMFGLRHGDSLRVLGRERSAL
ncbi:hypothetical protein F5Y08DRAFT_128387 [Xylaria arbuscula]|nr:hypothetical protein F5Y08DRAFT_128387 [Xylaria arbuscula]